MKHSNIDVAVLLIFFARSETFEKVFDAVRQARPSTLLLWQDGPREGRPDDLEGIRRCRKIAENIDWECNVYKQYNEKNFGCDPSTFYSHKWAFSLVDKCIVIEDDLVPSQSFFPFCKELLDRYENDERINHICGMNLLDDVSTCPYDYLFSINGSGVWGSWRRVAKGWDETYSFLHDEYAMRNLKRRVGKGFFNAAYKTALDREKRGKSYWETILGFDCLLNNRLSIIPKKNMISNIGYTSDGTHSSGKKELLPKEIRKTLDMVAYELEFPLKHPPYIVPDYNYMDNLYKMQGIGHPLHRFKLQFIYFWNCIRTGETGTLLSGIKRRIARFKGKL